MAYAVHTSTCTYLLDEDGVCCWIVSQQGVVPPHVRQCIGAQFVACLDVTIEGALAGDLRVGGRALFVQNDGEHMTLLRTAPIQRIDDRRAPAAASDEPPVAAAVRLPVPAQYGRPASAHTVPLPIPGIPPAPTTERLRFGVVEYHGDEQTITISKPTRRDLAPVTVDMEDHVTERHRR